VLAPAALFPEAGSKVVPTMLTPPVIVDPAVAAPLTSTANEKLPVSPEESVALVQPMLDVPPTGGVVQVQPPGAVRERNVVLGGTAMVSDAALPGSGPALSVWTA